MHTINIAMLLLCPCVSVCLSVAFKFLNESSEKILMKLEVLGRLKFQFQTLSNKKEEDMRTSDVWATLLTVHILCATGSWTNVKIYWVYIVIECEIARWRHCICLVEFSVTMKIGDWEQACEYWYGGKLCTCLQIVHKILLIKFYMWLCEYVRYRQQVYSLHIFVQCQWFLKELKYNTTTTTTTTNTTTNDAAVANDDDDNTNNNVALQI